MTPMVICRARPTRTINCSHLLALLVLVLLCGYLTPAAALRNSPSENSSPQSGKWAADKLGAPLARDPIFVYNDWSAYDELSDNIPLTEQLAMKELDEILRLRRFGVRFDYYMMDAFWFDPDGGYRTWRKPNWPNGPDRRDWSYWTYWPYRNDWRHRPERRDWSDRPDRPDRRDRSYRTNRPQRSDRSQWGIRRQRPGRTYQHRHNFRPTDIVSRRASRYRCGV